MRTTVIGKDIVQRLLVLFTIRLLKSFFTSAQPICRIAFIIRIRFVRRKTAIDGKGEKRRRSRNRALMAREPGSIRLRNGVRRM